MTRAHGGDQSLLGFGECLTKLNPIHTQILYTYTAQFSLTSFSSLPLQILFEKLYFYLLVYMPGRIYLVSIKFNINVQEILSITEVLWHSLIIKYSYFLYFTTLRGFIFSIYLLTRIKYTVVAV